MADFPLGVVLVIPLSNGVFVEAVLASTKADKDHFMVNNARELFQSLDGGLHASMTWGVFESKLDAPQMKEFFKAINVDPSEANGLFTLLDLDHSGNIAVPVRSDKSRSILTG